MGKATCGRKSTQLLYTICWKI